MINKGVTIWRLDDQIQSSSIPSNTMTDELFDSMTDELGNYMVDET